MKHLKKFENFGDEDFRDLGRFSDEEEGDIQEQECEPCSSDEEEGDWEYEKGSDDFGYGRSDSNSPEDKFEDDDYYNYIVKRT